MNTYRGLFRRFGVLVESGTRRFGTGEPGAEFYDQTLVKDVSEVNVLGPRNRVYISSVTDIRVLREDHRDLLW